MVRKGIIAVMLAVFLVGLAMTLYPCINGVILDRWAQTQAQEFMRKAEKSGDEAPSQPPELSPERSETVLPTQEQAYPELRQAAQSYNARLSGEGLAALSPGYERAALNLGDFGLPDEVFAVIRIPRLELELPVYLGADSDHLSKGAAVLGGTSLPIGGQSCHCVLAGHRGWRGAQFFRDIVQLSSGDAVYIHNLWQELCYVVTDTRIVDADEGNAIRIAPGEDRLTLMTCYYPPGGGKQRYLVICKRTTQIGGST